MPLSFVHAADFHLGADVRRFGPVQNRVEKAQFEALEKTLQIALSHHAAFVLICGDLFDRRLPDKRILEQTADIFFRFPSVPVFVLPGTHDFLSDKSVFASDRTGWISENLIVLNEEMPSPYHVPHTDCHLYFCPNHSNRSTTSPINGLRRSSENGFHVGLAHGSLQLGGLDVSADFPISPSQIEACHLDYLALGHWHVGRVEKYGITTAAYPGIAQPITYSDPEKGSILIVRLEDRGNVSVSSKEVSSINLKKIAATIYHPSEVSELVDKASGRDVIVKLALSYSDNFNETLEVKEIIEKATSRFLLLQSDSQYSGQSYAGFGPRESVNEQLLQAFRAEIARLREADSPERSKLYDKAAQLGVAIITGQE